ARTVHQLDGARQQSIQSVADDRMRLPSAHFHDDPGSGNAALNLAYQLARELGISIFVQVFHESPSSLSSASPSWLNSCQVRRASSASIVAMARPTCTKTKSPWETSGCTCRHTSRVTAPKRTCA